MKKHFFVFLTALAAVMTSSCKKENDALDNPNGPWSVELMAECESTGSYDNKFMIELAGTGTVTIDWGDGTVLKDFRMPELKEEHYEENGEEWYEYEGTKYAHVYDKSGIYSVKISGQDGAIVFLGVGVRDANAPLISGGDVSSLVLNHCSRLQYLSCVDYQLTSLEVSKCKQLKELHCGGNLLTSLDVSKNTQLEKLSCWNNELTSLDVSKNTQLKVLYCDENQLTSLDVSKNTQLEGLECDDNQLILLDVSKNTQLVWLSCNNNQLTSLDISKNRQLKGLYCYGNRIPVVVMNKIYNDLPVVGQWEGAIFVDRDTAGDYHIAENKGWIVYVE